MTDEIHWTGVWRCLLSVLSVFFLGACAGPPEIEIPLTLAPTVTPVVTGIGSTPQPELPKSLIVCLRTEPDSLYLYGARTRETDVVLEAVYDGPWDVRNYTYQPVILEKRPTSIDGDVRVEPVVVSMGDVFWSPISTKPQNLSMDDQYFPAGCRDLDCTQWYTGGEVEMDHMVVDFRLLPDLVWSDGAPLIAGDSVYSYELDADRDTPSSKYQVDRTYSYQALDDRTVQWIGIPGYLDVEYEANFWTPLPQHILGKYSAADLLTAQESHLQPIGWGPYMIEEWRKGEEILLRRNPAYFRSSEGLPAADVLLFRFIGEDVAAAIEQVMTGECDVLDESVVADVMDQSSVDRGGLADLVALSESGKVGLAWSPGMLVERVDFNLQPVEVSKPSSRLTDQEMRLAIAQCIDRNRLVEEMLFGLSEIPDSFQPPQHPLYETDLEPIPYNVTASNDALEAIGWVDDDGVSSTPRLARGIANVPDGTPLVLKLTTTPGGFHEKVTEILEEELAQCGIGLTAEYLPWSEVYAPWPDGAAFGRKFEMVGWAWSSWINPLCEMFMAAEIPSDEVPFGVNVSGFQNGPYDAACQQILFGPRDSESYLEAVSAVQRIFRSELPALPLYVRPRVAVYAPDICGIEMDPSTFSVLWNLERFATGEACLDD